MDESIGWIGPRAIAMRVSCMGCSVIAGSSWAEFDESKRKISQDEDDIAVETPGWVYLAKLLLPHQLAAARVRRCQINCQIPRPSIDDCALSRLLWYLRPARPARPGEGPTAGPMGSCCACASMVSVPVRSYVCGSAVQSG